MPLPDITRSPNINVTGLGQSDNRNTHVVPLAQNSSPKKSLKIKNYYTEAGNQVSSIELCLKTSSPVNLDAESRY